MEIKVVNVSVEDNIPTKSGKGFYSKATVTFQNLGTGKIEAKQIFPFSMTKELFEKVKTLEPNQTYSVTTEKDEGGFWVWTAVDRQDNPTMPAPTRGTAVPTAGRPQYETADERAAKQVYIIKQSSLATAVALLKTEKVQPSPQDVIAVAQVFTNWVMEKPGIKGDAQPDISDLQDDIPY